MTNMSLVFILLFLLNLLAFVWCLLTLRKEKRARLENENNVLFSSSPKELKKALGLEKRSHLFLVLGIVGLLIELAACSIPLLLCPVLSIASGMCAKKAGRIRAELRSAAEKRPPASPAEAPPPESPSHNALELELQKIHAAELRQKQQELRDIEMLGR